MVSAPALSYLVAGFAGSLILVYFVLKSAAALKLFASPTGSSIAESAGPRAGWLGFAVPAIVYLSLLAADGLTWAGGLLAGCAMLVVLSVWDDLDELRGHWRFAGQIAAVAVVLWFMDSSGANAQWHWSFTLCVGAAVLWQVRQFSLMDGIDAIAAVQCLLFCVGVQVLTLGIPGWIGDLTWLLAGSMLGFLVYNWPPAKIFMGRIGGALLGLLLAVITLQLWREELLPLVACLILLAGFWFDATYAVYVRMLGGGASRGRVVEGRGHLYQGHLYRRVAEKKGPLWTNVAYLAFGLCWLMPLSWLSLRYTQLDLLMLLLAVLPLGIAARFLMAPDEG